MNERVIDKINRIGEENEINLALGSNHLVFTQNKWTLVDSDLDVAATEIINLVAQVEKLKADNAIVTAKLEDSISKVEEITKMNDIAMDMLTDERRQNILLNQEVAAYKEELKKSFEAIVQLRTHLKD